MIIEFLLLILLFALICSRKITQKIDKLPPGPFKWPIIGNVIEVASADSRYPHLALAKLAKKHGEVMSLQFGSHPAIVVSSYEAMNEILVKDETMDRYSFPGMSDRQFDPHHSLGIIWGEGEMWRDVRRYTAKNMKGFGFGNKRSVESLARREIQESVSYLTRKARKNDGVYLVDTMDFSTVPVNILWSLFAGKRYAPEDPHLKQWIELSVEDMRIISFDTTYNVFPALKNWFPEWSGYRKHAECHKQMRDYMQDIVDNIRKERNSREDKTQKNFIERFLSEIESDKDKSSNYAEKQLVMILMDVFLGGSDTTGNTMVWSILYLTVSPEVQEKLIEVISSVVSPEEDISYKHIAEMTYLKATFLEVMRSSVFAPIPAPRIAKSSFKFREYTIPKGSCIISNITNVLNDVKFWGDPQNFRPERFIDSSTGEIIPSLAERVCVFGFGRRVCIGQRFGTDVSLLYLANIVRSFKFEAIQGQQLSPDLPIISITLAPRPFQVKFTSRRQQQVK